MDGSAWDRFCDRPKAVGRHVRRPEVPADPFTRAGGYRYHRTNVNKDTAWVEADGSVRIVLSPRNPGWPNWITTAGHANGTILFRLTGAEEIVRPTTRDVKARELSGGGG